MAKRPIIIPVDSSYAVVDTLNQNFQALAGALENTLSLDGSTPNQMEANLDLNGFDLMNARFEGKTLREFIQQVVSEM